MAAGDSVLVGAQTRSSYQGQSSKLVAEAWDALLDVTASNSNILGFLQGSPGSKKPFVIRTDLSKGRMETVNMNVGTTLGQAGRRGSQTAVNFEEQMLHGNWSVTIDTLRVIVGWNEINRIAANTGQSWAEVYAELCGMRVGQIEQEDMLMRLRQRSSSKNTLRPGRRTTLDTIHYDDTIDTQTLGRGISLLSSRADQAVIGTDESLTDVLGYVALGADEGWEPIWNDSNFVGALQHAHVDGEGNPFWTGKLPMWRGTALKRWYVKSHDNPGPIGSSIIPKAVLGDPITSATTAFTVYGGGRTQASLGNAATIYKPFEYFYGCDKLFGESISYGTDANTYYFVVIDPADGKWCMYSYVQAGVNNNGHSITISSRLHSSASGAAVTTMGSWTYDPTYNKVAFPTGSLIYQVNSRVVPVNDIYLLASEVGGKCYGQVKNKRIEQEDDYGALQGRGVWSIYGSDLRKDTLGDYRGFVRIQAAYEIPGYSLPQI